jgi:hypothetical protein
VEIIDNEVLVDGERIYYTVEDPTEIDGLLDRVPFYRYVDGERSLNQSDENIEHARKLRISLSSAAACKVWEAFEEVDRNNEKILQSMQE